MERREGNFRLDFGRMVRENDEYGSDDSSASASAAATTTLSPSADSSGQKQIVFDPWN